MRTRVVQTSKGEFIPQVLEGKTWFSKGHWKGIQQLGETVFYVWKDVSEQLSKCAKETYEEARAVTLALEVYNQKEEKLK